MADYVHGYTAPEGERLVDQASELADLLHAQTRFATGSIVLEPGCGVGAQTVILAERNPRAYFVSFDRDRSSVDEAKRRIAHRQLENVSVLHADLFSLPFDVATFDAVVSCFVLEHVPAPQRALSQLKSFLKPDGRLIAIEGDHGSAFFHPDSAAAHAAIRCQVELQRRTGGDAHIGRRLHSLVAETGFRDVIVATHTVYGDANSSGLRDTFVRKIFVPMIDGVKRQALDANLIASDVFEQGVADLLRTCDSEGVFCYTFFRAEARG